MTAPPVQKVKRKEAVQREPSSGGSALRKAAKGSRAGTNSSQFNPSIEGADVRTDRSACRRSRRTKKGVRSMGRYPFLVYAEEYLERREISLAKSSLEEFRRKAKFINMKLAELKDSGLISTTSPRKMNEADIRAFIKWMDGEGHESSYKAKNLGFVKAICEYAGNNVFAKMRADGIELPKKTPKELRSMSLDELKVIIDTAKELKGWNGEVTRFLVWMYPFTGLRASELRQAHLEDIDSKNWTLWVRHPKGEKRYAKQRTVPILPPARNAVLEYLDARMKRLEVKGIHSDKLIPNYKGEVYSANGFRRMKAKLEEKVNLDLDANIKFNIKGFRATYCQQNIDKGVRTDAVAVAMGHSSTKTTETYYGRMRPDKAHAQLNAAWSDTEITTKVADPLIPVPIEKVLKPNSIDRKYEPSGYA